SLPAHILLLILEGPGQCRDRGAGLPPYLPESDGRVTTEILVLILQRVDERRDACPGFRADVPQGRHRLIAHVPIVILHGPDEVGDRAGAQEVQGTNSLLLGGSFSAG